MKRVILLTAMMTLIPSLSQAGSLVKVSDIEPTEYRIELSGKRFNVAVKPSSELAASTNCVSSATNRSFYVVNEVKDSDKAAVISRKQAGYDQLFSTILLAQNTGSKIDIWVDDTICASNLPIVRLIKVKK